ncbi:M1 family metallopeptidase [Chloroflexus sp.]|uniref:M1 family metallopeptidase n=1 Tax=Chloroflexus sp. TaxID=1904827 RepID=UPI00298EFC88|nr:M1 family metallopeptidase [Chloroflexus sp.]MDW8404781.1 M1 family metallopeptidase [Chloroflexus sp.]
MIRLILLLIIAVCGATLPAQVAVFHDNPATAARTVDPFLIAQTAAMRPDRIADLIREPWDRYTMRVQLDPSGPRLSGEVTVQFTNRSEVDFDTIWFHLYPNHPDFGGRLDVTSAQLDGIPVPSRTLHGDTLIGLLTPHAIAPGQRATITMTFTARAPRNASQRIFGAYNMEAGVWSIASFYPLLARYIPGMGWDTRPIVARGDFTVSAMALYDVTVEAPADWRLVASGSRITYQANDSGNQLARFVSGPQREFYLAALQGLAQASAEVDGTRVVSYFRPDDPAAGERSLAIATTALRVFNQRFGVYPYAELEVIQAALTQFYGMEYPGVVLIEQSLYQRDDRVLETTIAHEISHQWWYGLVGNDAQGEAWLDEGLASYSQILYYEMIGVPEQAQAELDAFRTVYRRLRERGGDAPLATPPAGLDNGRYVPVVYAKGALFFHALRQRIGEEAFNAFLQGYVAAAGYREIAGPDLLRAAEQACECELDDLFHNWVITATEVTIP